MFLCTYSTMHSHWGQKDSLLKFGPKQKKYARKSNNEALVQKSKSYSLQ
jgi:hypothetical protein